MTPRDAVARTFEPPDKSMTLENSAAFQAVAYRRADRAIETLRDGAEERVERILEVAATMQNPPNAERIVNAILGPKKEES